MGSVQTTLPVPSFSVLTELRSKATALAKALHSSHTLSLYSTNMRTSLSLAAGAAVFLVLLLTTAKEAEAIRLDAESRAAVTVSKQQIVDNKPSENLAQKDVSVKSSGGESETTKRSIAAQEVRATAHKLPEFHEDYYGASVHEPRHH